MLDIDSISLALRLVDKVSGRINEEERPQGDKRKRMVIRIAAALEANVLTLGDKILLDLELKSLQAASEIVRQVFEEETGYRPAAAILPEVFALRSPLPELAASFGRPVPGRERPTSEAIAIFDELIENPDVSRRYEREAVITPEYPFDETDFRHTVAVESGSDRDKFRKLDDALEHSRFFEHIEKTWKASGKDKENFRIVIKTHLILLMVRDEVAIYADPTLVLHLVRRIIEAGYPQVAVAEGRNSYGIWYYNRGVCRVAARAGYIEEEDVRTEGPSPRKVTGYVLAGNKPAPFDIIDMGLNTADHDFGDEVLGVHPVNRDWVEADYRISFAKLKTHFSSRYALHLKNIFLALPEENKLAQYPSQSLSARAVASMISAFPVHFCIIDGITGSDKLLGYTHRAVPRRPCVIIAGQDLLAAESLGAQMMGIDPFESVYMREAAGRMGGLISYKVIGHAPLLEPWINIRSIWVSLATRIIERFPSLGRFWAPLFMRRPDDFFAPKESLEVRRRREMLRVLTGVRFLLFYTTRDRIMFRLLNRLTGIRVRRMGDRLKLSNMDPEFAGEAVNLRKDDLRRIRQILDTHGENILDGKEKVQRLGHIVRVGEANYPFLGEDALGAISAGRILKGIEQRKWSPREVIPEIEGWMTVKKAFGARE